jgi:hypothetical protein
MGEPTRGLDSTSLGRVGSVPVEHCAGLPAEYAHGVALGQTSVKLTAHRGVSEAVSVHAAGDAGLLSAAGEHEADAVIPQRTTVAATRQPQLGPRRVGVTRTGTQVVIDRSAGMGAVRDEALTTALAV